jgi:hypothetical protein
MCLSIDIREPLKARFFRKNYLATVYLK